MSTDVVSACIAACPQTAIDFHRAHQERLRRIAARAVAPVVAPEPLPEPPKQDPGVRVINRFGRVEAIISDATIREANERIRAVRPISVATIQVKVAEARRCTRADLLSRKRTYPLSLARHIGMYLAKKLTPFGFPEVGRRFGGRDHSSVLHACQRIAAMMKEDPVFAAEVEQIESAIKGAAQ